ncbi:hypothetical protein EC844_10766 [Acinetobacter calcoaceticus]|uniref:Uncharacterized protein n=1 Tax=Acinetobacter calcoaceticus TaxID=471 RepID=A0A4R1XWV9_ACICA|nr:hypothetical protein EC844_10766 [Acinetobacter calcoaceticus]
MILFSSVRNIVLSFIVLVLLVAVLFWLYLNLQASLQVTAHQSKIQLSDSLPTRIHVGNYLEAHAKGNLDTEIDLDQTFTLPLKGKYLANISFEVETPVTVNIDYQTSVKINTLMPFSATTDLVYDKKYLPKFPLSLDIPIVLDVPFHLKRSYLVPIKVKFNGPVYFDFDEMIDLPVKHKLTPVLAINDPMLMRKVASFDATMYNTQRESIANLEMNLDLPIKNVRP